MDTKDDNISIITHYMFIQCHHQRLQEKTSDDSVRRRRWEPIESSWRELRANVVYVLFNDNFTKAWM